MTGMAGVALGTLVASLLIGGAIGWLIVFVMVRRDERIWTRQKAMINTPEKD